MAIYADFILSGDTHLKFKGKEKYNTCRWVPQNKAIFICPGADAIPEETIFIIRSIKRLGMQVKHHILR